jgi:hypothetical protein
VTDDDNAARPASERRHRGHRAPFRFARSGIIEYDRVLFFSDAVFAIAITLLAIDLKVPRSSELKKAVPACAGDQVGLCHFGIDQPGLISFGISFTRFVPDPDETGPAGDQIPG